METKKTTRWVKVFYVIWVILMISCVLWAIFGWGLEKGYKHGQIDAIRGEIRYELKEKPNGETKWVFVEKEKK